MEVTPLKWKPLFAVLLGLLMVGVTAGSASAIKSPINDTSLSFGTLKGFYDPDPTIVTKTPKKITKNVVGTFKLDLHKMDILIFNGKNKIFARKNVSILKSKYFDGYVILFNNSEKDTLFALQGNVYKNGTIELFLKDSNGGAYVLKTTNMKLVKTLNSMNLPTANIDKNYWLPLVVPPKIKVLKPRDSEVTVLGGTNSVIRSDDEFILVTYQWLEPYEEQWYIQVRCVFEGPTNMEYYGDYKVGIEIVDEGKYIDRGTSFALVSMGTPLTLGSYNDPIEIGITAPWTSAVHDRIYRIDDKIYVPQSSYSSLLKWGFDLLTWYMGIPNPLSIIPDSEAPLPLTFEIYPGEESNSFRFIFDKVELHDAGNRMSVEGIIIEYQEGDGGTEPIYAFYKVPVYWEYVYSTKITTINTDIPIYVTHW
ncbi:hypothetical protein NF865_01495 [Thermococcus aggregans]|uniref:Uncharacterized protein n=1 Tax=Thermococcus aggregans TaxID=110163 RepID=A0A9E7MY31_THEAG|nr:hypothetical protein [Thermococcus aggregans]USS40922.1 hypothetical protein NF865_01495 [Thermococcus aggregans]